MQLGKHHLRAQALGREIRRSAPAAIPPPAVEHHCNQDHQVIPDEAVEAAAKAAYEFRYSGYKSWDELTPLAQCDAEAEMQYALLAAAPRMLAEAKAEGWDEGLAAGLAEWDDHQDIGNEPPNPYRNA